MASDDVVDTLTGFAKYPVPEIVIGEVLEQIGRYGRMFPVFSDVGLRRSGASGCWRGLSRAGGRRDVQIPGQH